VIAGITVTTAMINVATAGMRATTAGIDVATAGMRATTAGIDVAIAGMRATTAVIDVAIAGMRVTAAGIDVTTAGFGLCPGITAMNAGSQCSIPGSWSDAPRPRIAIVPVSTAEDRSITTVASCTRRRASGCAGIVML